MTSSSQPPAHPRVGGENARLNFGVCVFAGSSPRGRGKRSRRRHRPQSRRLIPAWAGKTYLARTRPGCQAAHPRVGGENLDYRERAGDDAGSSPRGRGKRVQPLARELRARLIPAWAGKTRSAWRAGRWRRAHPRVGGENVIAAIAALVAIGSSPRGRGKLGNHAGECAEAGLIPAWAGKTASFVMRPPPGPGSSPRGRGKQNYRAALSPRRRLIPAWAGKTGSRETPA